MVIAGSYNSRSRVPVYSLNEGVQKIWGNILAVLWYLSGQSANLLILDVVLDIFFVHGRNWVRQSKQWSKRLSHEFCFLTCLSFLCIYYLLIWFRCNILIGLPFSSTHIGIHKWNTLFCTSPVVVQHIIWHVLHNPGEYRNEASVYICT